MRLSSPLRAAVGVSVVGALVSIGLWVVNFRHEPIATDSRKWAEFGSYLDGTLAPILAFASFIGLIVSIDHQAGQRREESLRTDAMNHYHNATKSLERAFSTFVGRDGLPISDRLVWLTVARLILSAQSVAGRIELTSVKEMYEAEEEYWRRRFYDAIQPADIQSPLRDPEWFRQGERRMLGNSINEQSIRVIYGFTEWPETRPDPIDAIACYSAEELARLLGGSAGAREYILAQRQGRISN